MGIESRYTEILSGTDQQETSMAKTTDTTSTDEFADIELSTFTPDQAEGTYDRHVRAMLKADQKLEADHPDKFADGQRTSVKILTANDDKAKAKTIREFQDSARVHDRTGRKIAEAPQGTDGQIALTFILVPKQHRPRTTKPAEVDSTADVPEEVIEQDAPTDSVAA